ncbi:MAG: hypothetical protein V3S45_00395 [Kiloniellales bacterium]
MKVPYSNPGRARPGEGEDAEEPGAPSGPSPGCGATSRRGTLAHLVLARLVLALSLAVPAFLPGAQAGDLDFPTDPDTKYSITDISQFACLRDGMIRIIYVEYYGQAGEPPCAVVYEKSPPEEMSKETLWRSQNMTGFCETHAQELVRKLRESDWKCGLYRDVLSIGD